MDANPNLSSCLRINALPEAPLTTTIAVGKTKMKAQITMRRITMMKMTMIARKRRSTKTGKRRPMSRRFTSIRPCKPYLT